MSDRKPAVVIVGAGFGGLNAAKALRRAPVEVVMLDKNNYHLFQPLLYQVATSSLAPSEIAYPVRAIFRNQKNFTFRFSEVSDIDLEARQLTTSGGTLNYDYLILAPGGQTNFFSLNGVAEKGFGLKDLDEAIAIRNHILRMFERSTLEENPEVRRAMRTFVVVGGGPTGVESAGALSELIRLILVKDFQNLDLKDARVIVLEAMNNLLSGFPEDLSKAAAERLQKRGVEIRFGATVTDYDGMQVTLKDGEVIQARTLIWAAGIRTASLADRLGLLQGRGGRIVVAPTLQVPEHSEVFVIGDAAHLEVDGKPLPMVAPVAIQQGKLAAENILATMANQSLKTFQYKDPGLLATIGRSAAVAYVKGLKFHGLLAWWVWLVVHLFWLIGFRNRLLVMINWASDYLFFERAVRLITLEGKPVETLRADEKMAVDETRVPM